MNFINFLRLKYDLVFVLKNHASKNISVYHTMINIT